MLKSRRSSAFLLFIVTFVLAGVLSTTAGPFGKFIANKAQAAVVCTPDTAGPNDEPGQKDLTRLCVDDGGLPTNISVKWNWDELGTPGANTLDACALFDTDDDGNVNYSVCITTTGNPVTLGTLTIYSCGDDKIDRCTSPITTLPGPYATTCTISQQNTDPFPTGAGWPADTEASCIIALSDLAAGAELVDVCSYPSQQPNSDPSDCVIAQDKSGKLEVRKNLVPNTDPGKFNLQVNGVTEAADVGHGGTTGEVVVDDGANTVGETAGTATNLANYTSSIECRAQNGTGTVVASGTGTTLNVTVPDGSDIVCIITNTASGSITIVKDAVPNSLQDFAFTTTGTGLTNFSLDDDSGVAGGDGTLSSTRVFNGLAANTYSVAETAVTGWVPTSANCNDGSPVTAIVLTAGENVTCTFTNTKTPTLTVNKVTVPANDTGTFNLQIDGTTAGTGANVSNGGTTGAVEVSIGGHTVGETAAGATNLGDYTAVIGGDCAANGSITLAAGENKTCTITNTRKPRLTVTKVVVNDNGGTKTVADFPLFVDGATVTSGVQITTTVGAHTVSETTDPGYDAVIGGDCATNGSITLVPGDVKACTITNNDKAAQITVIKQVINDNGGTSLAGDFTMTINQVTATGGNSFAGAESPGTTKTLTTVGAYNVTEIGPVGYAATFSADCTGTIALGQTKTCTIINNDIGPTLTLVKTVINDNGGTAVVADFPLFIDGVQVTSGVATPVNAGTHTATETNKPGYTASVWGTDCAANGTITIALGQSRTCTITNNDNPPAVTRTQGYWQTHLQQTSATFAAAPGGYWTICGSRTIDDVNELLGGFWSSISRTSTGAKRSSLDQARMQMMQQLLAAMLNKQAFGADDGGLIAQAKAAYCGTDRTLILSLATQLDLFNNSGDSSSTTLLAQGKASPKMSKMLADYNDWDTLP